MTSYLSDNPIVRPAVAADAAGCLEIYAPIVRDTYTSFETEVPTPEEFARRIEETARDYPWLVCEIGGAIAGYAYARGHRERSAYQWAVEVSVFVAGDYHRRGVGCVLYTELFEILRRQGYFNAYAGIALPNPTSVAFHESMGFVPVGVYEKVGYKLGRWHDVGWWALRLKNDNSRPCDPVPCSELT
jgi:phosphinothricin acetyltransferase